MKNPHKSTMSHEDALHLLENAKKQYEQYVEVSGLYDITRIVNPEEEDGEDRPTATSSTVSAFGE